MRSMESYFNFSSILGDDDIYAEFYGEATEGIKDFFKPLTDWISSIIKWVKSKIDTFLSRNNPMIHEEAVKAISTVNDILNKYVDDGAREFTKQNSYEEFQKNIEYIENSLELKISNLVSSTKSSMQNKKKMEYYVKTPHSIQKLVSSMEKARDKYINRGAKAVATWSVKDQERTNKYAKFIQKVYTLCAKTAVAFLNNSGLTVSEDQIGNISIT